MIEKKLCENKHKLYIDWETGTVYEKPCVSLSTKYTVDSFGIFYLCEECYKEDCKRRIKTDRLTLKKDKGV
tara:strand:- start:2372 stop:2584 length:213 start_codon:yes stop_codon:yes gene_type:complete